ncbi:cache domain-containing sensor histidine kinase [Cohnella zeiphila]|uniref:histidine kinase n=1 Tax=Cohnella zeiphila TaxID=2761120 RepID=A0A7X0SRH4_9BACL|nr:sensor histidine kinase [Cohnella zeiphila]MBB6734787.1 sensor histidine kinase [Cohnella zeiphila]
MRLKDMRLKHRVFLYFSLLLIVSTISYSYYAYKANVRTAEENFTSAVQGTMAQTAEGMNVLLSEVEQQANLFAGSHVVQDSLAPGTATVIQQYDRYVNMQKVIDAFEKNYPSYRIRVFLKEPRRFLNDGERYLQESGASGDASDSVLFRRNSVMEWSLYSNPSDPESGDMLFTLRRRIISGSDISQQLGTVAFDVSAKAAADVLSRTPIPGDRSLYVFDPQGRILYDTGGSAGGGMPSRTVDSAELGRVSQTGAGSLRLEGKNGAELLVYHSVGGYPLYLAVNIPYREITNRSHQILYQFGGVALLVLAVSFALAYLIASNVTSRLKKLMKVMGTVEIRQFNIQVPTDRNDEIGALTHRFNWMIERIRTLIEDVYKANYEKKEAELKLLQSQINPHFLYNTLDSVNWLAVKHQAPDISYMVRNLSSFLRIGLHIDGPSTLEAELMHTRAYFNIQKYRFEDRIDLTIGVPESLEPLQVLPLILQPLVENAILHGILKHDTLKGSIVIRAWRDKEEGGDLFLEVRDNGLGMEAAKLKQVMQGLDSEATNGSGTGLRNVHRRIRMRHEAPYGLTVHSALGEGTRCVLRLPSILRP